jgi:hypothetical protein
MTTASVGTVATTADEASRFALICHHDDGNAWPGIEVTYWASRVQAMVARDALTPCGPRCVGAHTVVDAAPPPARPWHPAKRARPRDTHRNNTVTPGSPGAPQN